VLHCYISYGADTTNDLSEASPPRDPLYVRIDKPFRSWWYTI